MAWQNHRKCLIWCFWFWRFWPIFVKFSFDLSGNTVWPQAFDFEKFAKLTILAFLINFCRLKMYTSSLRSQCKMRLFLWFSNTMLIVYISIVNVNCLFTFQLFMSAVYLHFFYLCQLFVYIFDIDVSCLLTFQLSMSAVCWHIWIDVSCSFTF